jgi:hypothetical protein
MTIACNSCARRSSVPGNIELVEDTTGQGHITGTVGSEDRVTIQVPISDHP